MQGAPRGQRDRLGAAPGADERDGAGALDDEVGEQVTRLGGRRAADGRAVLAPVVRHQRRLPQRELGRPARRRVVGDRHDVQAGQAGGRHLRVAGGGAGQHEDRRRPVPRAHAAQPAQDERDVRAEHAPVGVALVDHDVLEVPEVGRPVGVPRQDAAVQHVGVREHEAPVPPHPVALLARGVAVVRRRLDGHEVERADGPELVGREGLGGGEVQHARAVVGDQVGQRGQQVGQRLPAGGPRRDDDRRAAVRELGRLHLVLPRPLDPAQAQPLDEQRVGPDRPVATSAGAGRDVLDVRHPVAAARVEQQPGQEGVGTAAHGPPVSQGACRGRPPRWLDQRRLGYGAARPLAGPSWRRPPAVDRPARTTEENRRGPVPVDPHRVRLGG